MTNERIDDTSDGRVENTDGNRTDGTPNNPGEMEGEANIAKETTQTTDATLSLEVLNQIKASVDAMLKKQENQEKVNASVNNRLDTLASAGRGRGQTMRRRLGEQLIPTNLFSTPEGAPRTRTFLPLYNSPETGEGSNEGRTTRPLEKNTRPADGPPQVVNLDEEQPTEADPGRQTDMRRTAPADPDSVERTEVRRGASIRGGEQGDLDGISDEDLYWIQQLDNRRDEALRAQKAEIAEMRARMERTAEDMKAVQSQMHRATSKVPQLDLVLEEAQNTPFTATITKVRVSDPGKIKLPTYEGKTDPSDHITAFAIAMGRANFRAEEKDAGQCLLFVEHLKGPAQHWFSRLEPNSIDNFKQLTEAFMKQYAMFMERQTEDADLWSLNQGQNESLKSFIDRFKAVLSKVRGLSDNGAIQALKKSLWYESDFRREIAVNRPLTIQDAMHRATEFAANEEEVRILAQKHAKTKPASQPNAAQTQGQTGNKKATRNHAFMQQEGGSEGIHNYRIDAAEFERVRGGSGNTRTRNSSDDTAYCEYHHVNGHSIANCLTLGLKLAAKLATEGRLTGHLKDFEMEESTEQLKKEEGEPPKRGRHNDDEPEQSDSRRRINDY